MIFLLLLLGASAVWAEHRAWHGHSFWPEIGGVTRYLLTGKGAKPDPVCRACGVPLPDPIFQIEIGHDAIVCEACEKILNAEVGLGYPEWFDQPMPEEPEVSQIAEVPTLGVPVELAKRMSEIMAAAKKHREKQVFGVPNSVFEVKQMQKVRFRCFVCDEWYDGVGAHECESPPPTYECTGCGSNRKVDDVCVCGPGGGGGQAFVVNLTSGLVNPYPHMNTIITPDIGDWLRDEDAEKFNFWWRNNDRDDG